jgi:hypothetical protein
LPDARDIVFHALHQVVALRVIVGNPLQHLTNDLVLALLRAEACMVVVIGEILLVQRQRDLEHFGARLLEFVSASARTWSAVTGVSMTKRNFSA